MAQGLVGRLPGILVGDRVRAPLPQALPRFAAAKAEHHEAMMVTEQIAGVGFDLYMPLWCRLRCLFGVPIHIDVKCSSVRVAADHSSASAVLEVAVGLKGDPVVQVFP